jgi:hypothetical protein
MVTVRIRYVRSGQIRRYLAEITAKLQHGLSRDQLGDLGMPQQTFRFLALTAALTVSWVAAADDFGVMSDDELRARIVGNTMIGEDAAGQIWSEYFDPSGELRGDDGTHGVYPARYTITESFLCFDYPGDSLDWCAQMFSEGHMVKFIRNDQFVRFLRTATIVPGNSMAF